MCIMCHYCGAGLSESNFDNKKEGNENSLKFNGKVSNRPCKSCGEKLERANAKWRSNSPYVTPYISPTTSLQSTDSCVSTCSKLPSLCFHFLMLMMLVYYKMVLDNQFFLECLIFQVSFQLM